MNFHIHSQDFYESNPDLDFHHDWHDENKKHQGHIPRSQNYYQPQPTSPVFEFDDEWNRYSQQNPQYPFSSPPRIKQEDPYTDNNHMRAAPYDPHAYQPLLSPLQTHHPISQPTPYYSPSFHHQPQNQLHHLPRSTFQPFGGTIHPSELSPTTDSCTSVSPTLSAYTDLSAVVTAPHDSHYVCQPQQSIDLKTWSEDRRPSIDSELSAHSHRMSGMDIGLDPIDGMALGMAGVVVGGMPIDIATGVGEECPEDGGEVDAEGDDDWDHAHAQDVQQSQFHQTQQMEYIQGSDDAQQDVTDRDGEGDHAIEPQTLVIQQQQNQQQEIDDDGEDEVPVEESDGTEDVDGEGEAEIKREYDSDFSESEEEDEDDPDDPEFVPRARRRPNLRRQSTFPTGNDEEALGYPGQYGSAIPFSNVTSEGRNLRPRSSSARYTPYPSSYPETSSAGYYSNEHRFDHHQQDDRNTNNGAYNDRANGRRYTSSSSTTSSSTHPPRSASSLSGSSGITTTTQSTRRRLRPSSTLPVPVPVPNLTKKSRGRRVPTMSSLEDVRSAASGAGRKRQSAGGKSARMYLCDVDGCGKCFARGEHLKRHVRSIHTYEKPHKCLYPGCGKDFSRHDNLGQHMRVHKDYVQEGVTVPGSSASPSAPSSISGSASSSRRKAAQTQA